MDELYLAGFRDSESESIDKEEINLTAGEKMSCLGYYDEKHNKLKWHKKTKKKLKKHDKKIKKCQNEIKNLKIKIKHLKKSAKNDKFEALIKCDDAFERKKLVAEIRKMEE